MLGRGWTRRTAIGLTAAGLLVVGACAPIPKVVDTPMQGARITLGVDQPMQVRWSNMEPARGAWVLEKPPSTPALTALARTVQPPANGAQQLEIFDFKGAQKGSEDLTFVYRYKDGQAPTADERITILVTVS